MKNKLFLIAVLLVSIATTGCIRLVSHEKADQVITNSKCTTHDECLSAINLPNPVSPDRVFIIEPKEIADKLKSAMFGVPAGYHYSAYMDVCVAQEIATIYPNSAYIIGSHTSASDGGYVFIHSLGGLDSRYCLAGAACAEFTGSVSFANATARIVAKGNHGSSWTGGPSQSTPFAVKAACADFARQVKETLDGWEKDKAKK